MANCNYKVKITDIQNKYKFKIFCVAGSSGDLSNYYTKSEADNLFATKLYVDGLVGDIGEALDLINGEVI